MYAEPPEDEHVFRFELKGVPLTGEQATSIWEAMQECLRTELGSLDTGDEAHPSWDGPIIGYTQPPGLPLGGDFEGAQP
jgi:hypothetical protein